MLVGEFYIRIMYPPIKLRHGVRPFLLIQDQSMHFLRQVQFNTLFYYRVKSILILIKDLVESVNCFLFLSHNLYFWEVMLELLEVPVDHHLDVHVVTHVDVHSHSFYFLWQFDYNADQWLDLFLIFFLFFIFF